MITSGCYSCLAMPMTSDSSGISDANYASDVMSMFKVDTRENGSDSDVADDVNTSLPDQEQSSGEL